MIMSIMINDHHCLLALSLGSVVGAGRGFFIWISIIMMITTTVLMMIIVFQEQSRLLVGARRGVRLEKRLWGGRRETEAL